MKHGAFSLYVKSLKSGREWYARYWNQAERRYGKVRATGVKVHGKRGRRDMALKAAWDMCDDIAANGGKQTVLQFFAKIWQEDSLYVKEFRLYDKPLSSSWLRNHAAMLNAHLKTYEPFKNLMLCDAEKNDILRYMLWLKDNGRSNGLINHIITNLRPGFDYAAENKLITANPCNGIKSLKEVRKEKGILTREEVAQALAELKGNELTFFALGACCGLHGGKARSR
jgi:hypothetical protein